jgi:hypothetical protein
VAADECHSFEHRRRHTPPVYVATVDAPARVRSLYAIIATAAPSTAYRARTIRAWELPWPSKYTTSRMEVTAAPGGRI